MGKVWAVKQLEMKAEGVLDAMERGKLKWGGRWHGQKGHNRKLIFTALF